MITIKCARCKRKIFRYIKIGEGRLLHCWKARIVEDYSVHDGKKVKCQCGNLIGIEGEKWIKMKQHTFTYSGSVTK